jgi:hypothetical protein
MTTLPRVHYNNGGISLTTARMDVLFPWPVVPVLEALEFIC